MPTAGCANARAKAISSGAYNEYTKPKGMNKLGFYSALAQRPASANSTLLYLFNIAKDITLDFDPTSNHCTDAQDKNMKLESLFYS